MRVAGDEEGIVESVWGEEFTGGWFVEGAFRLDSMVLFPHSLTQVAQPFLVIGFLRHLFTL